MGNHCSVNCSGKIIKYFCFLQYQGSIFTGRRHSHWYISLFEYLQKLHDTFKHIILRHMIQQVYICDLGTEELGHLEMIGTIVHQLTRNLSEKDIRTAGFDAYFVDHTTGVYPTAASGFPWNAASMAVKGDVIADLTENLAAEQKARVTYDNILRLSDDPDVNDVIKFLRAREVVHFQRFGEGLRLAKEKMDQKNIYFTNPAFDQ